MNAKDEQMAGSHDDTRLSLGGAAVLMLFSRPQLGIGVNHCLPTHPPARAVPTDLGSSQAFVWGEPTLCHKLEEKVCRNSPRGR